MTESVTPTEPPATTSEIVPYGFWWTVLLGLGSLFFAQQCAGVLLTWLNMACLQAGLPAPKKWIAGIGTGAFAFYFISFALFLLILHWCRPRGGIRKYCALRWPTRRELLLGLGCWTVFFVLSDLLFRLLHIDPITEWQKKLFQDCQWPGVLVLLVMMSLLAPVWEELLFRGFLFAGWQHSVLKTWGAILLTSALWASLHLQYELLFVGVIFCFGLLLGYLRHRSGSVTLCIMLHMLNNTVTFVITYSVVFQNHPAG